MPTPGELWAMFSSSSLNAGSSSAPIKAKDIDPMKTNEKVKAMITRNVGPRGITPARVTTLRELVTLAGIRSFFLVFVPPEQACRVE